MYLSTQVKQQEKAPHPYKKPNYLQKLYEFQKQQIQNKKCANCGDFGPTYICVNFGTFVCTTCAGIHRELHHRVKAIALSEWTDEEIQFILSHGNLKDRCLYLASLSESEQIYQHHHFDSLRIWIKDKYIHKKWYLHDGSNMNNSQQSNITAQNSVPLIQFESTATSTDFDAPKSILDRAHDLSLTQHKLENDQKANCQPETPTVSFFNFPDLTSDIVKNSVSSSFGDKTNNMVQGNVKQESHYEHQQTSLNSQSKSERQQNINSSNWATLLHNGTNEKKDITRPSSVNTASSLFGQDNILLPTDISPSLSSLNTINSTTLSKDTRLVASVESSTTDTCSRNSLSMKQASPYCDYFFDTLP